MHDQRTRKKPEWEPGFQNRVCFGNNFRNLINSSRELDEPTKSEAQRFPLRSLKKIKTHLLDSHANSKRSGKFLQTPAPVPCIGAYAANNDRANQSRKSTLVIFIMKWIKVHDQETGADFLDHELID
jgi:hypothetical protein